MLELEDVDTVLTKCLTRPVILQGVYRGGMLCGYPDSHS